MNNKLGAILLIATTLAACTEKTATPVADRVFLNGVVYTANARQQVVSAVAVRAGKIVYVGDDAGARALIGGSTVVADLAGKMVLPGLHDMHIHPMGIVDTGGCDLNSEPRDLAAIAEHVAGCVAEHELAAGEWLPVLQWSFAIGNQPTDELQTLRQALDVGAPDNPVILWGNDGHHGAVNSQALALARNAAGEVVGITASTLEGVFSRYKETIGADAKGEPNGELHETARELVNPPPWRAIAGLPADAMPQIAALLARNGITSVQDAAANSETLALYKSLAERGSLGFHLSAAVLQDPDAYTLASGEVDVEAMVADLVALRTEYAKVGDVRVATAKIFVDGVMEGNPFNDPPTLPNAAVLQPYHQPRYQIDLQAGEAEVVGYVDAHSAACLQVRAAPADYDGPERAASFKKKHGYYPAQCAVSRGVLEHPADFVHAYMVALDKAGFAIHAHVIGDRAVRTALEGFELARASNGVRDARHSLAHIQLVAPEDFQRVGDLGLYLVFTYAWINPDVPYDLTVNPFIDQIAGVADIYNPQSYYMRNNYPVKGLQTAGAVLAAGSDAPVDTRDPRPFSNMQQAITRSNAQGVVQNAAQRVPLTAVLDAYTINGARLFGHDVETGSLEVGKMADLIVIDQDLLALEASGRADEIANTRVLLTLLEGHAVYEAN